MFEKFQTKVEGLFTALGIIFLVAFSAPIIFSDMRPATRHLAVVTQIVIWLIFIAYYAACIATADSKKKYIKDNAFGIITVALPVLQPFRALRALAVVVFAAKKRGSNKRRSLIATTSIVALATWFFAGLAVTEAERLASEPTIHNVGDGWWWSITTMATVGYGDTYPTTTAGRFVGGMLMVISIALIGTMTATIASYFTEIFGLGTSAQSESNSRSPEELRQQISELQSELRAIEQNNQN